MQEIEHTEQYSETTRGIRISVIPRYMEGQSDPARAIFAYAYTVKLENLTQVTAQLINRHWLVVSGGRQIADVKGEGVIGEQPILNPGDIHEYTSWTVVHDPVASMHGTYTFRAAHGEFFDVRIPKFMLIYTDSSSVH